MLTAFPSGNRQLSAQPAFAFSQPLLAADNQVAAAWMMKLSKCNEWLEKGIQRLSRGRMQTSKSPLLNVPREEVIYTEREYSDSFGGFVVGEIDGGL